MEIQLQSWRTLNLYSKSHRTPRYQKQEKKKYFNSNIPTLQIMQLVATLLTGVAVVGSPVTLQNTSVRFRSLDNLWGHTDWRYGRGVPYT